MEISKKIFWALLPFWSFSLLVILTGISHLTIYNIKSDIPNYEKYQSFFEFVY